jgi:hypothetical protein
MINITLLDDGTPITEQELKDISTRVTQTRFGSTGKEITWGTTDNTAQAVSDRARLLRLLMAAKAVIS